MGTLCRRFESYSSYKNYLVHGSAWRGHLTVTQEKQVGSNPICTAKYKIYLNINKMQM